MLPTIGLISWLFYSKNLNKIKNACLPESATDSKLND